MIPKERLRLYPKALKTRLFPSIKPFPIKHSCLLCDTPCETRVCNHCQQDFIYQPDYQCQRCALPLEHEAAVCGDCLLDPPAFDHCFCPFLYQKPLSDLILKYKENRDFITGRSLYDLLISVLEEHYLSQNKPLPDLITPVPSHWYSRLKRGFNHTDYLSQCLSQTLTIPVFRGIKKVQLSPPQKNLNRKERMRNLAHSFRVSQNTEALQGKHIAVIDDVMTTGATANTLAHLLKKNGAQHISIWAIARTPKR